MQVKVKCISAIMQEDREEGFHPQTGAKVSTLVGQRTIAEFENLGDITVHLAIKGTTDSVFDVGQEYTLEVN